MTSISKSQIDKLGERLKRDAVSDDDLRQLDAYRLSFADAYEEVVSVIRGATKLEPTGRPAKSTTSIVEKLRREHIRLTQMQDIAGCRLVVEEIVSQDEVVAQLNGSLAKAVVVDRRIKPSYGYRAVHIIATARNKQIEIQIRSALQHLWAQLSEKLSDALDQAIKYGGGDLEIRELLSERSDWIGGFEELELERSEVEPIVAKLLNDDPCGVAFELKHRLQQLRENQAQMREEERQSLAKLISAVASLKAQEGN